MAIRAYWSPMNEFVTLKDAMDRLVSDSFINPRSMFDAVRGATALPANLYETPDSFIVQVALPGINPDQVHITVKGEMLNLKGEVTAPQYEKAQQIWSGIPFGSFDQSFSLPTAVEAVNAQAHFENGLLTLNLPKVQNARSHTIEVTGGSTSSRPVLEGATSK
jgi:HSP20 family protein